MTRHGWYEWRPDPRDERLYAQIREEMREDREALEARMDAMWCQRCERDRPAGGCPACGSEQ